MVCDLINVICTEIKVETQVWKYIGFSQDSDALSDEADYR